MLPLHRLSLTPAELRASPIRTQGEEGRVPGSMVRGSAGGAGKVKGGARELIVGSKRAEED